MIEPTPRTHDLFEKIRIMSDMDALKDLTWHLLNLHQPDTVTMTDVFGTPVLTNTCDECDKPHPCPTFSAIADQVDHAVQNMKGPSCDPSDSPSLP